LERDILSDNHHYRGEVPLHENYGPEARYAVEAEALIPTTKRDEEIKWALEVGLQGADSIVDRTKPTFSRGELPHFAGINTFLKSHYLEDVRRAGEFNVAVLGAPFDGGTTYRSGTRFGPQGIRKISALYGPYSFELGVDLRESLTVCDLGDIFTIGNIEDFDQIRHGARPRAAPSPSSSAAITDIARRCGRRRAPNGKLHHPLRPPRRHPGNRLDERMHMTPRFHATDIPNVPPEPGQIGIGGLRRASGVKVGASAAPRS
jgi:agmatinase